MKLVKGTLYVYMKIQGIENFKMQLSLVDVYYVRVRYLAYIFHWWCTASFIMPRHIILDADNRMWRQQQLLLCPWQTFLVT